MPSDQSLENQLFEIWEAADQAGDSRIAVRLLEKAVRLADVMQRPQLQFDIRRDLINVAYESGDADRMLVAITWCLGRFNDESHNFDEYDFLNECLLALQYVSSFVNITKQQIEDLFDDIHARFRRLGASTRSYMLSRCFNAFWMGEHDKATDYLQKMRLAIKDDLYNPGWEAIIEADMHWHSGNDEALLSFVDKIPDSLQYPIAHQYVTCFLLCPLLQFGRAKEAQQLFETVPPHKNARETDRAFGQIIFLFATRQFPIGIRMIEEIAREVLEMPSDRDRFLFFVAAAFGFERLHRTGNSFVGRLPNKFPGVLSDLSYTTDGLATACMAESIGLAERFNSRNGSTHFSTLVERVERMHEFCS